MSLRLRRLRLIAQTDEGPYGVNIPFHDGLTVLRARNSRGKSTCVQAIVYALGLEAMLTTRHEVPLPHAMTDRLNSGSGELAVRESWVTLEVENGDGEVMTTQRWAKSDSYDINLIRTWQGPALSHPDGGYEQRDTFARRPGAARAEAGFLNVLENFLGWRLPVFPIDGREARLYPEMVFPLFFVEQKRGWSAIQAQMPPYPGVPEPRQRAIEFTLALDVYERSARRRELNAAAAQLTEDWKRLIAEFRARLEGTGVTIRGLPEEPQRSWPPDVPPAVLAAQLQGWRSLGEERAALRARLDELSHPTPTAEQAASETAAALEEARDRVEVIGDALRQLDAQYTDDRRQAAALRERLAALDEDIRQSSDAATLVKLGGERGLSVLDGYCPTCHQEVRPSLVGELVGPAMSAAENVTFLREQRSTFQLMLEEAERAVQASAERRSALRDRMRETQAQVRALREALIAPANAPSEAEISEKIVLRQRLQGYDRIEQALAELNVDLEAVAERYAQVRAELDDLPDQELSAADRDKLTLLERQLVDQLRSYGFSSLDPAEISISDLRYIPSREGYDLGFDLSASDWIRLIWAYLLALLEVAAQRQTNHPGLLVFDEPRQHDADPVSMAALLDRASRAAAARQQVIFATSESESSLNAMIEGLDATELIDFGDAFILRPL